MSSMFEFRKAPPLDWETDSKDKVADNKEADEADINTASVEDSAKAVESSADLDVSNQADPDAVSAESQNMDTDDTADDSQTKETPVQWILGWIDDLVAYFVVFIILMIIFIRPVVVDGDSMKTTLYNGDVLLLSSFGYTPQYGDIIVVSRENIPERPLIKRVIAVSGDVVNIDYTTYTVYVNGVAIEDDHGFVLDKARGFGEHTDSTEYPYVVPENCVFVMGDNRGNSSDSRECGAIEYGQILGKAICRVYRDTSKYEGSLMDFNLYD